MLPVRDGVGASQVGLPPGPWATLLDFLVERFPAIPAEEWRARMERGDVVDAAGQAVAPLQAYVPHGKLFYYRSVPNEVQGSVQASVLFEDELLVVADKPHHLAVTPAGGYLQETLLVRLRRQLDAPGLTPIHRIDRDTAGVVLFARQAASCAPYQAMFAGRQIAKQYEAIAPFDARLSFPLVRTTRLVPAAHFMQMREAEGEPNARTQVALLEVQGAWARYRLHPETGKRHQLRVHMAALGLPILGDRIYPQLLPTGNDAPDNPLRLLAQRIAFRDPVSGQERAFASLQRLHFPV